MSDDGANSRKRKTSGSPRLDRSSALHGPGALRHSDLAENLFYVFVCLPESALPIFYVVPREVVAQYVRTATENGWRPQGVEGASTSIPTCDASRTPKGSAKIDGPSNQRLERSGAESARRGRVPNGKRLLSQSGSERNQPCQGDTRVVFPGVSTHTGSLGHRRYR
jgi:hypothetical protein